MNAIAKAISDGRTVELRGLFSVKTKTAAARTARNPRTGAVVHVPEARKLRVKISNELKQAINAQTIRQ